MAVDVDSWCTYGRLQLGMALGMAGTQRPWQHGERFEQSRSSSCKSGDNRSLRVTRLPGVLSCAPVRSAQVHGRVLDRAGRRRHAGGSRQRASAGGWQRQLTRSRCLESDRRAACAPQVRGVVQWWPLVQWPPLDYAAWGSRRLPPTIGVALDRRRRHGAKTGATINVDLNRRRQHDA